MNEIDRIMESMRSLRSAEPPPILYSSYSASSSSFTYVEGSPVNYRSFARWLFSNPNLKMHDEKHAKAEHCLKTIEISLGVSEKIAQKLLDNAEELGLIQQSDWGKNIFGVISWYVGYGYYSLSSGV